MSIRCEGGRTPLNKTILELKLVRPRWTNHCMRTLNKTILELKHCALKKRTWRGLALNKTILELKLSQRFC